MGYIKALSKRIIGACGYLVPTVTKVSPIEARKYLDDIAPKPNGKCKTNNKINLQYDLQIIIPAYNAEKYIYQCLNSVLIQPSKYKVLVNVVNDGSTDGTADILRSFSDKMTNNTITLEIITQENKGFSGARNTALQNIKGTYVTFLDSDDVFGKSAINTMLDAAYRLDADILQGSWYTFEGCKKTEHYLLNEGILENNQGIFSGYPWGKLYKYTVLEHFHFPENFWFEDTPCSFILAAMPYRCAAIKDIVYGYRQNPEGISATAGESIRSVESYWITEKCLEEFPEFSLLYDQRAYEYLLRQSIINEGRTRHQSLAIREAQFILTAELIDKYFTGFETQNSGMKKIESALKKRQFIRFDLLTLSM